MTLNDYMSLMFGADVDQAAFSVADPSKPTVPTAGIKYYPELDVSYRSAWVSQQLSRDNKNRAGSFIAQRIFCLDDIGTKIPMERVAHLVPTARLETSPGNFQLHFKLTGERCADADYMKALREAVTEAGLSDPGVNSLGHLVRVPGGLNMKEDTRRANNNQSWLVRAHEVNESAVYTPAELAAHFGVEVVPVLKPATDVKVDDGSGSHYYDSVYSMLERRGMLQGTSEYGQFTDCPFQHEHTDKKSTRTEFKAPSARNNWHGALVCPHGHCVERSPRKDGNILSTAYNEVYLRSPERDADLLESLLAAPEGFNTPPPEGADSAFARIFDLEEMVGRFGWIEDERAVYDMHHPERAPRPWQVFVDAYASSLEGKKEVSSLWRKSPHQQVHHRTFDPSQPTTFYDEQGLRVLNTYVPQTFPPVEGKDEGAERFLDLLKFLAPEPVTLTNTKTKQAVVIPGHQFLEEYIADMLQNPGTRPHCHILLLSRHHGTGRSTALSVIANLVGRYGRHNVDLMQDVLGAHFNEKLTEAIAICVDETEMRGEMRYDTVGKLKSVLTNNTLTVNAKNERLRSEKCVARYFMATNSIDAIPIEDGDRRLAALRCPDAPKPVEWYAPITPAAESGVKTEGAKRTLAALYHYFMARPIQYFTAATRVVSETKEDMKAAAHWGASGDVRELVSRLPHACITVRDAKVLLGHLAPADLRLMGKLLMDAGLQRAQNKVKVAGRPEWVYFAGKLDTDKVRLTHEWVEREIGGNMIEELGIAEV